MKRMAAGIPAALSAAAIAAALVTTTAGAAPAASPSGTSAAAANPLASPFYRYTGATPLADLALGAVLKTRTITARIQGVPTPLKATQLLFRTQNALGKPDVGVTTVIKPSVPSPLGPKVIAYDSFYDSLNPADEPSAAFAGGTGSGNAIPDLETGLIAPLLLAGYTIVDADTEGQTADFAAGPEYGHVTLDSLRAATRSAATGIGATSPIGLVGYSGGAIGAGWAAQQAPTYAPGIAGRIVGTAIGGVLVDPAHNLHYVSGSQQWADVMPMALAGVGRAYHVDLTPYLSATGRQIVASLQKASITTTLGTHPGLTWQQLAKPAYNQPEKVPVYVRLVNRLIMGRGQTPTAPMFIGQGAGGRLEGTSPSPTYGKGDGVMVTGDVRTLAREYCSRGVRVRYQQYPLSHTTSAPLWIPQALGWLEARFLGTTAPSSCGAIAPGNPLTPLTVQR